MKNYHFKILERADFADRFGNYRLSDTFFEKATRLASKKNILELLGVNKLKSLNLRKNPNAVKQALIEYIKTDRGIDVNKLDEVLEAANYDIPAKQKVLEDLSVLEPSKHSSYIDNLFKDIQAKTILEFTDPALHTRLINFLKDPKYKGLKIGTGVGTVAFSTLIALMQSEPNNATVAEAIEDKTKNPGTPGTPETPGTPGTPGTSGPGASGGSGGSSGTGSAKVDPNRYLGPSGMYNERIDANQQQQRDAEARKFISDNESNKSLNSQRAWRNKAILHAMKEYGSKPADDKDVLNFANDVTALIRMQKPDLPRDSPPAKPKDETDDTKSDDTNSKDENET